MDDLETQIAGIAALNEPVRRALYLFVGSRPGGVGRDEAARAVSISRALAAFHLDKLVDERLLEAGYRRLNARKGPGAGRPAKIYRRSERQLALSLPRRSYELAARLLIRALERGEAAPAVAPAARELGAELGAEARRRVARRPGRERLLAAAEAVLAEHGFEPDREGPVVRMRNCPFGALATDFPDLVCGMNRAFVQGFLEGLGADGLGAEMDAQPGACCVLLRAAARRPSGGR